MNHFPLFALMVRIKDPGRLPGRFLLVSSCALLTEGRIGGVYFQFAKHNREVLCIKVHWLYHLSGRM